MLRLSLRIRLNNTLKAGKLSFLLFKNFSEEYLQGELETVTSNKKI